MKQGEQSPARQPTGRAAAEPDGLVMGAATALARSPRQLRQSRMLQALTTGRAAAEPDGLVMGAATALACSPRQLRQSHMLQALTTGRAAAEPDGLVMGAATALARSPRQLRQSRMLQALTTGGTAAVLQRQGTVDSPAKLDFFINKLVREAKTLFPNAFEEDLDALWQYVKSRWYKAYEGGKVFTLEEAKKSLDKGYCLKLLGKDKSEDKTPFFRRIDGALIATFSGDTDHEYGIATKPQDKVQQFPPSTDRWLDQLWGAKLIKPEEKTGDPRKVHCLHDNIVRTKSDDEKGTATALYTINHTASKESEIAEQEGAWQLHAHVETAGTVDFAHTKRDALHACEVTTWVSKRVPAADLEWQDT